MDFNFMDFRQLLHFALQKNAMQLNATVDLQGQEML